MSAQLEWNEHQQIAAEISRRTLVEPVRSVFATCAEQQVVLSTTIRGVCMAGGGNQSGKSFIVQCKIASFAEGYHRYVMCPSDCPNYGVGSCGLHGCPGAHNGSVDACEAVGKPIPCDVHKPLSWPAPRRVVLAAQDYDHIYDLLYENTLRPLLSKTLSGALTWKEPSKLQGRHKIEALDGSYIIELVSMAQGGKKEIRGKRAQLFAFDELPPYDAYREMIPRLWRFNGQCIIGATHDTLLDTNSSGQWIFPQLVDRVDPGVQVVSISTRNNFSIDVDRVIADSARLSPEERAIRIDGGFGFRQSRCVFDEIVLSRTKVEAAEPKEMYLHGSEAPQKLGAEREAYYGGPARFPDGCEKSEDEKRVHSADFPEGIACVNCLLRCKKFVAPPVSIEQVSVSPDLSEWKNRLSSGRMTRNKKEAPKVDVYEEFKEGHIYVGGGDVAQGRRDGDNSSFLLVNAMTGEHAVELTGKWSERDFAYYIYGIYKLYNNPLLVIESNGPGRQVLDILLYDLGVKNVFCEPGRSILTPTGESLPYPGVLTTSTSKEMMVRRINTFISEGVIRFRSKKLAYELQNFIREEKGASGKTVLNAMQGAKDDRVMAAGLLTQGWDHVDRRKFRPEREIARHMTHKELLANEEALIEEWNKKKKGRPVAGRASS